MEDQLESLIQRWNQKWVEVEVGVGVEFGSVHS